MERVSYIEKSRVNCTENYLWLTTIKNKLGIVRVAVIFYLFFFFFLCPSRFHEEGKVKDCWRAEISPGHTVHMVLLL